VINYNWGNGGWISLAEAQVANPPGNCKEELIRFAVTDNVANKAGIALFRAIRVA
jgi:hypothetical protein